MQKKAYEMTKTEYAIITPMKNEEPYIGEIFKSVENQTMKPNIWIIVDDGSTDNSKQIVKDNINKTDLKVILISKNINNTYNWLGYSRVIKAGEEILIEKKYIEKVNFIAILDSDTKVEKNYFQKLINFLDNNPDYGCVSGEIYINSGNEWRVELSGNSLRGSGRLYTKNAYINIGFFPETPSPDFISDILLLNRDYKIKKYTKAKAYQFRASTAGSGKSHLFYKKGISYYINDFPFHYIFSVSLFYSFTRKPYLLSGLFVIVGYIIALFSEKEKIKNQEVRFFCRNVINRIWNQYL